MTRQPDILWCWPPFLDMEGYLALAKCFHNLWTHTPHGLEAVLLQRAYDDFGIHHTHLDALLDPSNRRGDRSPRVALFLNLNQKGNLTLHFEPVRTMVWGDPYSKGMDFTVQYQTLIDNTFSHSAARSPRELMWFRDAGALGMAFGNTPNLVFRALLFAIRLRYEALLEQLEASLDVRSRSTIEFIYDGNEPTDWQIVTPPWWTVE
jgi:hypothetical protein